MLNFWSRIFNTAFLKCVTTRKAGKQARILVVTNTFKRVQDAHTLKKILGVPTSALHEAKKNANLTLVNLRATPAYLCTKHAHDHKHAYALHHKAVSRSGNFNQGLQGVLLPTY